MRFIFEIIGEGIAGSVDQKASIGFGVVFFSALFIFRMVTYFCEYKAKKEYREVLTRQGYIIEKKDMVKSSTKVYKIMRTNEHFFKPKYDLVFIKDRTDIE